jgi:hypothetical protein
MGAGGLSRPRYRHISFSLPFLNALCSAALRVKERTSTSRGCSPALWSLRESVDGYFGRRACLSGRYRFAGLALSFFVFFSTPHEPLQPQPQSASAMLVQPSTLNKPAAVEARAKQSADHSEKHATAAGSPGSARASARDVDGKHAASSAQARRLIQEERARRWAYRRDSSFERRFLDYAD